MSDEQPPEQPPDTGSVGPGGSQPGQPPGAMPPMMLTPQMFPWMGQPQLNLDSHCIANEAPVRVRAAFAFLTYMGHRLAPTVAINEMSIEIIDAPALSTSEDAAFHAAANALEAYFLGKLPEDKLESTRAEANRIELYKRRPGQIIVCVACAGGGQQVDRKGNVKQCSLCEGSGKTLVVPAKHSRNYQDGEEKRQ